MPSSHDNLTSFDIPANAARTRILRYSIIKQTDPEGPDLSIYYSFTIPVCEASRKSSYIHSPGDYRLCQGIFEHEACSGGSHF